MFPAAYTGVFPFAMENAERKNASAATVERMPEVFRERGFRFFFYLNEGSPREPVHIHVEKDDVEAKFWLFPEVQLAYNYGYTARTLRELATLIDGNRDRIERAWSEHFG